MFSALLLCFIKAMLRNIPRAIPPLATASRSAVRHLLFYTHKSLSAVYQRHFNLELSPSRPPLWVRSQGVANRNHVKGISVLGDMQPIRLKNLQRHRWTRNSAGSISSRRYQSPHRFPLHPSNTKIYSNAVISSSSTPPFTFFAP
jgi:hypothetical protein